MAVEEIVTAVATAALEIAADEASKKSRRVRIALVVLAVAFLILVVTITVVYS